MTDSQKEKSLITIGTIGILSAIVLAIIYFMKLPIFSIETLSWLFVFALVAGAAGITALIIRSIWVGAP